MEVQNRVGGHTWGPSRPFGRAARQAVARPGCLTSNFDFSATVGILIP